jgi:hypothetical protein
MIYALSAEPDFVLHPGAAGSAGCFGSDYPPHTKQAT